MKLFLGTMTYSDLTCLWHLLVLVSTICYCSLILISVCVILSNRKTGFLALCKKSQTGKNNNNYLLFLPVIILEWLASARQLTPRVFQAVAIWQHLGAEVISKATSVKCLEADACYELGSHWAFSTTTPTHDFFTWLGLLHSMAAGFQGWMSHERNADGSCVTFLN